MIGNTISHYKIIEKLGEGGMGIVYKAEDIKLKRTVALKFLPPELTRDEEAKKRFLHEARAASALDHPNICSIYEIDKTEDGRMFMAMAHYEGQTLKNKILNHPLPVVEAIDIAMQIAEGLNKAHKKDIVHRDIKPANIIITDEGMVKILDFGLAKLKGATKLTREGTTLGTVAYMSPEQAAGEEVDQRTDIWALGIILYEMLTGLLPFRGEYPQAILYAIMNQEPEPLTALRTGIPLELEHLVRKALQKNPADRYQTLADMIVDLRQISAESGKIAPDHLVRSGVKRKKLLSRNIKWLAIPFLGILLAAGYLFLKEKPSPEKAGMAESSLQTETSQSRWTNSIAVLPFANISADPEQEYFCDGMTEDIITRLTEIRDLKVISRTTVMRYRDSQKSLKDIGDELDVKNILEGSVRREKNHIRITAQLIRVADDAHLWAKNFDRELESIFEVQDEVSQAIAGTLKLTLTQGSMESIKNRQTQNLDAYEYYLKGMHIFNSRYIHTLDESDYDKALILIQKALELDPDYVGAYMGLMWIYSNHYIYARQPSDFQKLPWLSEKLKQIAPDSAERYGIQGMVHLFKNEFHQAFLNFRQGLDRSPNYTLMNFGMGFLFFQIGLYEPAIDYCLKAIEIDPLFLHPYMTGCRCMIYNGEYDRAGVYLKKATDLYPNHPRILEFLCLLDLRTGRLDEAEKLIRRLDNIALKILDTNRWRMLLYALRGQRERALSLNYQSPEAYSRMGMVDEAIAIMEKRIRGGKDSYDYLYLIHNPHYDNLREDRRFQTIVADARKIYEDRLKKFPVDQPFYTDTKGLSNFNQK